MPKFPSARLGVESLEAREVPANFVGVSGNGAALLFFNDTPATDFIQAQPGPLLTGTALGMELSGNTGRVLGIDYRPANGILYGVTTTNRLITIDTATGATTLVGALTPAAGDPFTGLSGTAFDVDFNPVADALRVVSNTGQNLRVDLTGTVTTQGNINSATGTPSVAGSAYSNNFAGATATTLYGLDDATDTLVAQDPATGTVTAVGTGLGPNVDVGKGTFDIVTVGTDTGYAVMTDTLRSNPSITFYGLYAVNLTTGAATLIGDFSPNTPGVSALAAVLPSVFNFGAARYSVAEDAGSVTITVTRTGSTAGTATVDYATGAGTATPNADFTTTAGTLTFADGVASRSFAVPVALDGQAEPAETFPVTLSNPSAGAGIGTTRSATVTITDVAPPSGPAAPPAAPAPAPDADAVYVQRTFGAVLGRSASEGEIAAIRPFLADPVARFFVANLLVNSPEARFHAIDGVYKQFLGRPVDLSNPADVLKVAGFLNAGTPLSAVIADITGAPLALLTGDVGAAVITNQLFNQYLGRDASPAELFTFGTFFKSTGSIETIAAALLSSGEYLSRSA